MGLTRRKKKRTHVSTDKSKKGGVGERGSNVLPDSTKKVPACFIIGLLVYSIYSNNRPKDGSDLFATPVNGG